MALAGTRANKRVQRELEKFLQDSSTDGLTIEVQSDDCWNVKFSAAIGTIYEGENYTLQVKCKWNIVCSQFVPHWHHICFSR